MTASYRGFPYANLGPIEAPSLTSDQIAQLDKWRDLPRKKLHTQGDQANQPSSSQNAEAPKVVDSSDSGTSSQVSSPTRPSRSKELDDTSTVYIDIPKNHSSTINLGGSSSQSHPIISRAMPLPPREPVEEDRPVLYIDIPEENGSEVSAVREEPRELQPEFVQETIFYDQFKDRRIDGPPAEEVQSSSSVPTPGPGPSRPAPSRPPPPSTLDVNALGSSSGYSSYSPSIPPMLAKETYIYRPQPPSDDGFSLTPLPLDRFPEMPPPYEEIDRDRDRVQIPGSQTGASSANSFQTPPRTQVITSPVTPVAPVVLNSRRKLLTCQYCHSTVQTLVVKENGYWTHFVGVLFCILCLPLVIFVYCTSCCKCLQYSNHYCPQCNKKIGYKSPLSCRDRITFVYDP